MWLFCRNQVSYVGASVLRVGRDVAVLEIVLVSGAMF